jgi:hypothetical protein
MPPIVCIIHVILYLNIINCTCGNKYAVYCCIVCSATCLALFSHLQGEFIHRENCILMYLCIIIKCIALMGAGNYNKILVYQVIKM